MFRRASPGERSAAHGGGGSEGLLLPSSEVLQKFLREGVVAQQLPCQEAAFLTQS